MNKHTRLVKFILALVMGAIVALTGVSGGALAHPAQQSNDPVALLMALAEAYNNADVAKMNELLDPSFQEVTENFPPPLTPEDATTSREEFIEGSKSGLQVTLSNCTMTAPDTASCDLTAVGGDLPPLPHPFMQRTTATVRDGKIVLLSNRLSEQTYNDFVAFLAALPGMPTTGSTDLNGGFAVLALLALTVGALLRRPAKL